MASCLDYGRTLQISRFHPAVCPPHSSLQTIHHIQWLPSYSETNANPSPQPKEPCENWPLTPSASRSFSPRHLGLATWTTLLLLGGAQLLLDSEPLRLLFSLPGVMSPRSSQPSLILSAWHLVAAHSMSAELAVWIVVRTRAGCDRSAMSPPGGAATHP